MLKIEIDRQGRGPAQISAAGSLVEMIAELALVVNTLFTQLEISDPEEADEFRTMVQGTLADPDSPVWTKRTMATGISIHMMKKEDE